LKRLWKNAYPTGTTYTAKKPIVNGSVNSAPFCPVRDRRTAGLGGSVSLTGVTAGAATFVLT
jgi:hypothetical protein